MSNALAAFEQAPLQGRITYAEALAKSNLLPEAYRNQPSNVLVAVELGASLGLAPMTAINGINVIKGKPSLSASLMSALVRRAGCKLRVTVTGEGQQAEAVATLTRPDDTTFTFESRWTWSRAHAAGLTNSRNWQAYPEAMMKARAISEVCREGAADYLSGLVYIDEELTTPTGAPSPVGPTGADSPRTVEVASVEVRDAPLGAAATRLDEASVQASTVAAAPQHAPATPPSTAPSSGLGDGDELGGGAAQDAHSDEDTDRMRIAVYDTASALDYSEERLAAGVAWASGGTVEDVMDLSYEQAERLIDQMLKNEEAQA